ncbi:DUF4381 domain-containing protein [Dyella dinghuensis]|uniref:DUF4381 domain-containing protein n=1 Tax=Dyella dinghuensis TaxID=1920169 RepID=A0A432LU17_9GAMM|nr:DUF4381 family protein [Dyella dinghuensis]RUL64080.1 DUF4381 domain-containing protein [Dyella dinghuensis]
MNASFPQPQSDVVLRDVHMPPSPPWWPPAPGWWVLLAIACVALFIAFLLYRRWRRARMRRQQILAELHALATRHGDDDIAYASSLHQLLRRAARRYATDAHQRQGAAWREVLARVPVDTATLDKLMTLDARMYQPRADFDRMSVQAAAYHWLETALRREKAVAGSAEHA